MRHIGAAKHDDPRIVDEVRPYKFVFARVVELVDAEVPRPVELLPDEIVRAGFGYDVDVMRRAQLADERSAVIERIGEIERRVTEPGDAHSEPLTN